MKLLLALLLALGFTLAASSTQASAQSAECFTTIAADNSTRSTCWSGLSSIEKFRAYHWCKIPMPGYPKAQTGPWKFNHDEISVALDRCEGRITNRHAQVVYWT